MAARHAAAVRRYPLLADRPSLPAPVDRTAIVLGADGNGAPFFLPERARLEHAFCIGTTGSAKSTLMLHCAMQDIIDGRGVMLLDPHGEHPDSVYRSLLSWMKACGYLERRTVHLIDPNVVSHSISFNPLERFDADTDLSVIAGVTLEAFSRAWGGEDTARKPTIERVLTGTFSALAELNLTLVEAPLLLDRRDRHGLRRHAIATVTDRFTRDELQRLDELSHDERYRQNFDLEVIGPINRLARFLRPAAIRAPMGQVGTTLDLREAMDNGDIILCNLSGGSRIYQTDADLLGRLLTRFVFFHAKRRSNPDRPFFVYMDECHRYLSGDLESILAETRKYGVGVVLATQWLQQLRKESDDMLAAVLNGTNLKVVFRAKDPEEAERLAEMVIPFDLETPVRALIRPTVTGHRRVWLDNDSTSQQRAVTKSRATTTGESESRTESYSETAAESESESDGISESQSHSTNQEYSQSVSSNGSIGRTDTDELSPNLGLFGSDVIGMSQSRSASVGGSQSRGSTTGSGRSVGSTRTRNVTRGSTNTSTWGESHSRGTHRAETAGDSETHGETRGRGRSEALEPILIDLPSAVHSRDNMRYMAAQAVRNLRTGYAFANYVGMYGMVAAPLKVPHVQFARLSAADFDAVRQSTMACSPYALPMRQAVEAIALREKMLLDAKQRLDEPEPTTFRTAAPPTAPRPGRSRPAASSRGRSRRSAKPPTEAAE